MKKLVFLFIFILNCFICSGQCEKRMIKMDQGPGETGLGITHDPELFSPIVEVSYYYVPVYTGKSVWYQPRKPARFFDTPTLFINKDPCKFR